MLSLIQSIFLVFINIAETDFMRQTGKIHVVYGVLTIIFIGIIVYLIFIEKKIRVIEKRLEHDKIK